MIIEVGIQKAPVIVPGVQPVPLAPAMAVTALRGLIDTGAQVTCIARSVARNIGLRPRGKARLGNVSTIEVHNQLRFVVGALYDDNDTRGHVWFDEVVGVDFKDNDDFDVLIGMDLIGQGDLIVRRGGNFRWELP